MIVFKATTVNTMCWIFVWACMAVMFPFVDLKLLAPCYQGNTEKVTRLTGHTVSARCWKMTSIFT